ncbi:hypothetical protein L6452_33370 [Arctium lappa]|uniref:Uncharacterized protein n=1 Tax=Arctium lappa TaxID=4217 RepID=A0ACB8YFX2_ARCLA|nr:hypothetical protein L6452_33370 [Arctium lappa]
MSEEISSTVGAQGMHQEEQYLVNMMASSTLHGFDGQIIPSSGSSSTSYESFHCKCGAGDGLYIAADSVILISGRQFSQGRIRTLNLHRHTSNSKIFSRHH